MSKKQPRRSRSDLLAQAIAWSELTDHGRNVCDWQKSFSANERNQYRKAARYIMRSPLFKSAFRAKP